MSLPITAVGPLNVETNPILMESPAKAGVASASAVAPASQNAVLMSRSLLVDIAPTVEQTPSSGALSLRSRAPALEVRYFVREIRGQQQAPSARSLLEPSAQPPFAMHHSSWRPRMARIIVPIADEVEVRRSDPIFGPVDDVRRMTEIADSFDLPGRPLQQHEIFRCCIRLGGIEHQ